MIVFLSFSTQNKTENLIAYGLFISNSKVVPFERFIFINSFLDHENKPSVFLAEF